MPTIIHDATIVTANEACTVQYDSAIAVEADHIGRAAWQCLFAAQPALVPPAGWHPVGGE